MGDMEVQLYRFHNGQCPYLEDRFWETIAFESRNISNRVYEELMNMGFRRSGCLIYKNECPNCQECIPLRIGVTSFQPSRSQKRILKKNKDLKIKITSLANDEESYNLYRTFSKERFQTHVSRNDYEHFLLQSPVTTKMMKYYLNDRLLGVSWIDLLDSVISSVYFAFATKYSRRSLGTYSILQEIELAQRQKKQFLYLGFYIADCPAMSYKLNFNTSQLLFESKWQAVKKI